MFNQSKIYLLREIPSLFEMSNIIIISVTIMWIRRSKFELK